MIITIDGPAGTGKSSVAKLLAQRIGFTYFDTGAMYRAVTWALLHRKIAFSDKEQIERLLKDFHFRIESYGNERHYFVDATDITEAIRGAEVTRHVSEVAALFVIRSAMADLQKRFAKGANTVFEGRDLGSVVFPHAELKIYLTADPQVRAERRYKELLMKRPSEAENLTKEQVMQDIMRRDAQDASRDHSPMKPAADAIIVDTSHMSLEQVVEEVLRLSLQHIK